MLIQDLVQGVVYTHLYTLYCIKFSISFCGHLYESTILCFRYFSVIFWWGGGDAANKARNNIYIGILAPWFCVCIVIHFVKNIRFLNEVQWQSRVKQKQSLQKVEKPSGNNIFRSRRKNVEASLYNDLWLVSVCVHVCCVYVCVSQIHCVTCCL